MKKEWCKTHRAHINAHAKARIASDPSFRLARLLRARIQGAVKAQGAVKSKKTQTLVGCDINFLLGYIEARFQSGMKWSNYGKVWEIDHRIPCSKFDLTDESHQRSCFHYSNLQPLFVTDNRKKHAKMPASHQAELI